MAPLPGLTLVQEKFSWFTILPGHMKPVINYLLHISQNPSWTDLDYLLVLGFDEIHLTRRASFDNKLQRPVGPNKDCQVMVVRGLISKIDRQFPIFSKYDFTMDVNTLNETISILYSIKYVVTWVVCDQGPKNRALINSKNLNITPNQPYFSHPNNSDLKVHFAFDSIHLLKSLASHVRDDYCMLSENIVFTIDDFQHALDSRGVSEIAIGRKLTPKKIYATGQTRQNVGYMRTMFSPETADLIENVDPNDPRLRKIGKFCRDIDSGAEVLTSNDWNFTTNKLHAPLGKHLPEQLEALETFRTYFETMRFKLKNGNNYRILPFQHGMLITVSAVISLLNELKSRYNVFEFLTERTTQESFTFSENVGFSLPFGV